jgi:hypothetical protein
MEDDGLVGGAIRRAMLGGLDARVHDFPHVFEFHPDAGKAEVPVILVGARAEIRVPTSSM